MAGRGVIEVYFFKGICATSLTDVNHRQTCKKLRESCLDQDHAVYMQKKKQPLNSNTQEFS